MGIKIDFQLKIKLGLKTKEIVKFAYLVFLGFSSKSSAAPRKTENLHSDKSPLRRTKDRKGRTGIQPYFFSGVSLHGTHCGEDPRQFNASL